MGKVGTPRHKSLIGQRFGRLVVIAEDPIRGASRSMKWICRCDCGTVKSIGAQALRNGATVSCGCYNREINSNRVIHGHEKNGRKSPTYTSWEKMLSRCYREKDPGYSNYGGRGISVCEEWHTFANFLKDMGERPKGTSIDRINPDGNYEPGNCRWITQKEQTNNTRRNVYFIYDGKRLTISQLADIAGIEYNAMYGRLAVYKWPLERAMNTPKMHEAYNKKLIKV